MQIRQEQLLFAQLKRVRHLCVILLFAKYKQWGTVTTSNKIYGSPFTITFPKSVLAVIPVHKAGEYAGISLGDNLNNVGFQCWYSITANTMNACYIAIGY